MDCGPLTIFRIVFEAFRLEIFKHHKQVGLAREQEFSFAKIFKILVFVFLLHCHEIEDFGNFHEKHERDCSSCAKNPVFSTLS